MPEEQKAEAEPDRKVLCAACNGIKFHQVIASEERSGGDEDYGWWEEHRIVRCRGCGNIAYELTGRNTEDIDEQGLSETRHVYPEPNTGRQPIGTAAEFFPWDIERIYDEVLKAHNLGLRILPAIGVRGLVEAVCRERGCRPAKLWRQIDELVDLGIIPQHQADVLHEIRFVGNEAAHELGTISTRELAEAIDAVEDVLRGIYVLSARGERMLQRRTKREARKHTTEGA